MSGQENIQWRSGSDHPPVESKHPDRDGEYTISVTVVAITSGGSLAYAHWASPSEEFPAGQWYEDFGQEVDVRQWTERPK